MTRALLLDENMPRGIAAGSTLSPGISDRDVLRLAREGARILLTFDADFGDLIFQQGEAPPAAVLYFRVRPIVTEEILALALEALAQPIDGCFVVVAREGLRSRPFAMLTGGARL